MCFALLALVFYLACVAHLVEGFLVLPAELVIVADALPQVYWQVSVGHVVVHDLQL